MAASAASAAAASASSAAKPPSLPTFRQLLRNTKYARFDPSLEQVYTSHRGFRHRGDYGVKRPLPRTANRYVRVRGIDYPPQALTNYRSAAKEVHFVKRFEETGWGMANATRSESEGQSWRNVSYFDTDSDRLLSHETGVVASSTFAQQPHSPPWAPKVSRRTLLAAEPAAKPAAKSYHFMSDAEFEVYLEQLRSRRPNFKSFVAEMTAKNQIQAERAAAREAANSFFSTTSRPESSSSPGLSRASEPSEASEAPVEPGEADLSQATVVDESGFRSTVKERQRIDAAIARADEVDLFEESQRDTNSKYALAFVSSLQKGTARVAGRPSNNYIPANRQGNLGLSYARDDVIHQYLHAPHIPARVIEGDRNPNQRSTNSLSRLNVLGLVTGARPNLLPVTYGLDRYGDIIERQGQYHVFPEFQIVANQDGAAEVDNEPVNTTFFSPEAARRAHDTDAMVGEPKWLTGKVLQMGGMHVYDDSKETAWKMHRPVVGSRDWVGRAKPQHTGASMQARSPLTRLGYNSARDADWGTDRPRANGAFWGLP